MFTTIELFAGAGGLALGVEKAGFNTIGLVEVDRDACDTLEKNRPNWRVICDDIANISSQDLSKLFGVKKGELDLLSGGAPCQAFSYAGKRLGLEDARGTLFYHYAVFLEKLQPKMFLFENVRGLLSAEYPYKDIEQPIKGGAMLIILDKLRSFGYSVSFNLYNAANFGAPQIRERVVIIAKLGKNKVPYLKPTNSNEEMYGLAPWKTLSNAINNIPKGTKHHYIEFPEKRLKYYRMLKEGQYWKDLPPEIQVEAMGKKLEFESIADFGNRYGDTKLEYSFTGKAIKLTNKQSKALDQFVIHDCVDQATGKNVYSKFHIIINILKILCFIPIIVLSKSISFDSQISNQISNEFNENFQSGYILEFFQCNSNENRIKFGTWQGTIKGCGTEKNGIKKARIPKENKDCKKDEINLEMISPQNIFVFKGLTICGKTKENYYDLLFSDSVIEKIKIAQKGLKIVVI